MVAPPRSLVVVNAVKCDLFSAFNLLSSGGTGSAFLPALHRVPERAAVTRGGRSSNTKWYFQVSGQCFVGRGAPVLPVVRPPGLAAPPAGPRLPQKWWK